MRHIGGEGDGEGAGWVGAGVGEGDGCAAGVGAGAGAPPAEVVGAGRGFPTDAGCSAAGDAATWPVTLCPGRVDV
jgi:hypothetical protein